MIDKFLVNILNNLSVGVVFVNREREVVFINSMAESLLKADAKKLAGKRVEMLPVRSALHRVLSGADKLCPVEMQVHEHYIDVRAMDVKDGDGNFPGEVFELRDITREKRERRQREEFVAMMTHDLKSPLTVIMGYVQAVREGMFGEFTDSIGSTMVEIERSGQKLFGMIEDILDAYRLEMGILQIQPEYCDVRGILLGCYNDYCREAEGQGIKFSINLEGEFPAMKVDGKQIGRVFSNLIGNAVKFTPQKRRVSIFGAIASEMLAVSVEDTGIGIPPKDLPRIFNKYFRAEKAAGFKGTGLGLTISRAIVEAHGGTIEVESVEGKGSRFTVRIPLSQGN